MPQRTRRAEADRGDGMKKSIWTQLFRAKACSGWAALTALLVLLGGCATSGNVPPPPPEVAQGPAVLRFEDGRSGFVIHETARMDAAARRDFEQAVAAFLAEDFERAIELLDGVVDGSPGVSAPYIDLAMAYRKIERPELAEEQLNTALELIPGHPLASHEYGLLLREAGRFVEARKVYRQALQRFPEYLPLRRNLGILCDLYLNDTQCALEQFQAYGAAQPDDDEIRLWISELQLRSGR